MPGKAHKPTPRLALSIKQRLATALLMAACTASAAELSEIVLEVHVNSQPEPITLIAMRNEQDDLWLEDQDLIAMRLRLPHGDAQVIEGRRYIPLAAFEGATIELDASNQMANLILPASAFMKVELHAPTRPPAAITRASWGGFMNYDVTGEHNEAFGANNTIGGAFAEAGVFSPYGVFTSTGVGAYSSDFNRATRLDTTFRHDFVADLRTLSIGDAISHPGAWGRAMRFGGLQWGRNYGIRPDLITAPLLAASGQAVAPATVDVFLNNQQISSQQVAPGPFVIDRLPAITGAGDIRVVVRDVLGREQVITTPFYASPNLLRSGLNQYSLELGAMRNNYGIASNDYGPLLASGMYRHGFTDWLTLEGHAVMLRNDSHAAGVNTATRLGSFGVFNVSIVNGGDRQQSGWLTGVGLQRVGQRFSFNTAAELAEDGFKQPGDAVLGSYRSRVFAQTGVSFGRAGSLAVAYAVQEYRAQPRQEVMSLTYSLSVKDVGFFSLVLGRSRSTQTSNNALLIFTMPLSGMRSLSATARYDNQPPTPVREVTAMLQQSPPLGPGHGYRLSASTEGNYNAQWISQFEPAAVQAEAAKFQYMRAERITVLGGAVWLGKWYATRNVYDSFALVEAPGIPDLIVYADNQPIARTDEQGRALIRNLRPYEENRLSVDPTQLPLDTALTTTSITVTPMYRSGALARFPIERVRAATLKLLLEDGQPVPVGAQVTIKGKQFPVALDGMLYVTEADHSFVVEARWPQGRCAFRLPPPPTNDPLPDLGTVTCLRLRIE